MSVCKMTMRTSSVYDFGEGDNASKSNYSPSTIIGGNEGGKGKLSPSPNKRLALTDILQFNLFT